MRRSRCPDWADRVMSMVEWHQRQPFAWGRHDCATLFADVLWAITNEDPLARFRTWTDELSATRALYRTGSRTATELVQTLLPQIEPAQAARGDFGYARGPRLMLQFPAIIVGAHAVSRNAEGWISFDRGLIVEAYSIDGGVPRAAAARRELVSA